VNAAVLGVLAPLGFSRRLLRHVFAGAAFYALAIHALIITMSYVPFNDFAEAVGYPREGTALSAGGALLLGWLALRRSA
jgi:hypothetical protein